MLLVIPHYTSFVIRVYLWLHTLLQPSRLAEWPPTSSFNVLCVMASSSGREFRQGGRRQRQAARSAVEPEHGQALAATAIGVGKVTSALAKYSITQWAWGQVSSAEAQRLAAHASDDERAAIRRAGGREVLSLCVHVHNNVGATLFYVYTMTHTGIVSQCN